MIELNQRRFNVLAAIGAAFAFALLAVAFFSALRFNALSSEAGTQVQHTFEVLDVIARLETQVERAETASRGYLLARDEQRRRNFDGFIATLQPLTNDLAAATRDNPRQQRLVAELRPKVILEMVTLENIMDLAVAGRVDAATEQFRRTANHYNVSGIRTLTDAMRREERRLLAHRRSVQLGALASLNRTLQVVGMLLFLLGLGFFLVVYSFLRQLRAQSAALNRLNTDLEGVVAERTADLQRANDEIQRFAYIVSHDLRSPLVNVMGFTAELVTANAAIGKAVERIAAERPDLIDEDLRIATGEDLPEAIDFIRSSTKKMDRLINAILGLSRQGRRVLVPEQLPMAMIFGDIAANLSALADQRGASIIVEPPIPDIVSDRLAIEQIFSNLIENAIKYSDDERHGEVRVRGRAEGAQVVYEIIDNGRGISPDDRRRVFELFRRSGRQDQPGEGIGLAYVNSLVIRLGGTIDLESELGRGSTFTVSLPAVTKDKGES